MVESNKADHYSLQLDELTEKQLNVYLYENVENIQEIHEKLISKELPCCIVRANLIVDPFQITIAANKAALNEKYEQMITRIISIHKVEEKESTEKLISNCIKGKRIPISRLSEFSDINLIKKTYKIDEEELKISSLLDSIVSRISDKITK